MRRMEKITGRSDDMIILRGVNVFPTQIEEQLMSIDALAPHFQIELERDDRLDKMIVKVEGSTDVNDDTVLQNAADELASKIKSSIGVTAQVLAGNTGSVPRSQGKAVRVVDNRPKS